MINNELHEKLVSGSKDAFEQLIQLAVQEALKMLPIVNENIIKQSAVLHKASEQFYQNNPDLVDHKPMVASVIERLESDAPGTGFDEILKKAGPEVRKAIGASSSASTTKRRIDELDDVVGKL